MNNQQYNVITGKRFYTESDGAVNAFRVVHVWHEGKIECIDEANGETIFVKKKDLKQCKALIPDALYVISLVSTAKAQNDIIIYIMRKEDIQNFNEPIPYIIGRQMIVNESNPSRIVLGDHITNARENKELALFLTSSKVYSTMVINSYKDDSIEDIENLMPKDTRKSIDKMMAANFIRFKTNSLKHNYTGEIMGPRNIHELLTSMQKDIDASLGIYDIDPNTASPEDLEEYIGHKFTNLTMVEYKKDIDLEKIQSDYFLTRRVEDGKVYLVSYSLISDDILK